MGLSLDMSRRARDLNTVELWHLQALEVEVGPPEAVDQAADLRDRGVGFASLLAQRWQPAGGYRAAATRGLRHVDPEQVGLTGVVYNVSRARRSGSSVHTSTASATDTVSTACISDASGTDGTRTACIVIQRITGVRVLGSSRLVACIMFGITETGHYTVVKVALQSLDNYLTGRVSASRRVRF